MLHLFIIPHVQTQSNRVCNSYVILLWLMLPRDHFVSRFLTLVAVTYNIINKINKERRRSMNAKPYNCEHFCKVMLKSLYACRTFAPDKRFAMTSEYDLDLTFIPGSCAWHCFLKYWTFLCSVTRIPQYERKNTLDKISIFYHLKWPWRCIY
jgi:hypothetical protein